MARWRDVKKGKVTSSTKKNYGESPVLQGLCVSPLIRLKAFITDMFMIMMPIMYITTYIIMDGKDDFQANDMAHWITMGIYGVIIVSFWVFKGQTPGLKAYDIILLDDQTGQTLGWIKGVLRYIAFLVSAISIIGFLLPFFRKDKKTFQDLLMQTSVVPAEVASLKK